MNYKIIDKVQIRRLKVGDIFIRDKYSPNSFFVINKIYNETLGCVIVGEFDKNCIDAGCFWCIYDAEIVHLTNLKMELVER